MVNWMGPNEINDDRMAAIGGLGPSWGTKNYWILSLTINKRERCRLSSCILCLARTKSEAKKKNDVVKISFDRFGDELN